MSDNFNSICKPMAEYLSARLDVEMEFVDDVPWQERERRLDEGQIEICWICGLPCILKLDEPESKIELLAAPVMAAERYFNQSVYYSDIVVHRDSKFRDFAHLRGATWAYNEPRSHSGFNLVAYNLELINESWSYFGKIVESGAHQQSIRFILSGKVDASAIDSTVLEWEIKRNPVLKDKLRIIETFGPSPIPPLVILKSLSEDLKERLRCELLRMHLNDRGRAILRNASLARFIQTTDSDYDVIRQMAQIAAAVKFNGSHPNR